MNCLTCDAYGEERTVVKSIIWCDFHTNKIEEIMTCVFVKDFKEESKEKL